MATVPGEFQYIAAGTGVLHSEYNPSDVDLVHFRQIWIEPEKSGATPAYGERAYSSAASGRLHLIARKSGGQDSIRINQDSDLWLAKFSNDKVVTHELRASLHAWIHVAEGAVNLNGMPLAGVAVSQESRLELAGKAKAQVLLFDFKKTMRHSLVS